MEQKKYLNYSRPAKHLESSRLSDVQEFCYIELSTSCVAHPFRSLLSVPVGSSGTSSTVSMRRPLVVPDGVVSSEVGLGTVRWCNSYFTIIYLAASYVSIYVSIHPSIHLLNYNLHGNTLQFTALRLWPLRWLLQADSRNTVENRCFFWLCYRPLVLFGVRLWDGAINHKLTKHIDALICSPGMWILSPYGNTRIRTSKQFAKKKRFDRQ